MLDSLYLEQKILSVIDDRDNFNELKSLVYQFQYTNNPLYRKYCDLVGHHVKHPYLPIQFFKKELIKSGIWEEQEVFESSGTTGMQRSRHALRSTILYKNVSKEIFENVYGSLGNRPILALLPSYIERKESSLIYMVNHFMEVSGHRESEFVKFEFEELYNKLRSLQREQGILIGVSFALLDFVEKYSIDLSNWVVLETGGMKGKREEMLRTELHNIIRSRLNLKSVGSEYGMTELFSQAYAQSQGRFTTNRFMKVEIREIDDPFTIAQNGRLGRIYICDLANLHTISFIATDDLGRMLNDHEFTVEGRLDNSDLRGCNLLYH